MDIGNRIDKLREDRKMSKNELARLAGLSRTGLINVLENVKSPSIDTLQKICDALNVPIITLFSSGILPSTHVDLVSLFESANEQAKKTAYAALEFGQIQNYQRSIDAINTVTNVSEHDLVIPVIGKAAAGLPIEMIQDYDTELEISDQKIQPGDFAVIADGDSMIEAGIKPGDRVIIRPEPYVEDGELALIAVGDGSTIKYFYMQENGYKLVPANEKYSPQIYPQTADIRVIGKVIKVADSFKEYINNI